MRFSMLQLSVLAQQTAAVVLSLLYFLVDVRPTYAYDI